MFAPDLAVLSQDKYRSVPNLGFLYESNSLAYFAFWENCRKVCL